MFEVHLMNW